MSKVAIAKIWKQLARIEVTQPFHVVIPTIRMETVVAPHTNFIRGRVLIGFAANLGHGLKGILVRRNLNRNSRIPIATIGVVATP
jgi:hypothetical protein